MAYRMLGEDWHTVIPIRPTAGPDGGSAEKPVGLVYIATSARTPNPDGVLTEAQRHDFPDNGRDGIRRATVLAALAQIRARLGA